jgi:MFS family permease
MAAGSVASARRSGGIFYGWVVVGAAFVMLLLGFACSRAYAAFLPVFRDRFHADLTEVSLVFSILTLLELGLGVVSGPLADRLGPRRMAACGVGLAALGMALASRAQALWQVYVTYGLGVGLGIGLAYVPAVAAVQHWFVRRRATATGIVVAGNGTGIALGAPVAAVLIDAFGWRTTFLVLAGTMLVLGGAASLLIEGSPARRGLLPDGDLPGTERVRQEEKRHINFAVALHSSPFWLLFFAGIGATFAIYTPYAHLEPFAQQHGISAIVGALLVGAIGLGSITGRLIAGPLDARLGRRQTLIVMYIGMTLAMAWWLIATSVVTLALFAVPFGIFYGGFVALVPSLLADYYGTASAGAIIGFVYLGAAIGAFAGPIAAGAIYDALGSYELAIAFGVICCALATVCALRLPDIERWRATRLDAVETPPLPE